MLWHLITKSFSLRRNSMRSFHWRRILVLSILFPLFTFLLVTNHFFLLLDHLLFPNFKKRVIKDPVFIVSMPRSGTTFLFHALAELKDQFTCVKLWEIIFAPSICQKYLFLFLNRMDRMLAGPIRNGIIKLEKRYLGRLNRIHLISLFMPEEDEAFLIWNLQSGYFNYCYPEARFLDDILLFDEQLPLAKQDRIMRYYRRYIQRHDYVFNSSGKRRFLSKNPLMMNKVKALSRFFPDAYLLNINRSPAKVIPSTLALNRFLYATFSAIEVPTDLDAKTRKFLICWYEMAEAGLQANYSDHHLKIMFDQLVKLDEANWMSIASFLQLPAQKVLAEARKTTAQKEHGSKSEYQPMSDAELQAIFARLPFLKSLPFPS